VTRPDRSSEPWAPLGRALLDFHRGATDATFTVHSDLWDDEPTLVEEYYRPEYRALPEIEERALSRCRGRVLDVGAGAGRHALELQQRGLTVTAIDIAEDAVTVMRERGVRDARCGHLDSMASGSVDTILLLMHGIGLVGTLSGLELFLRESRRVLSTPGQIICDSADLTLVLPTLADRLDRADLSPEPYFGEVEFRLTYGNLEGRPYPWLFVDPSTLDRQARASGFDFEMVTRGSRGAFVAALTRQK
jgi:SAM-dependent methyltransferase